MLVQCSWSSAQNNNVVWYTTTKKGMNVAFLFHATLHPALSATSPWQPCFHTSSFITSPIRSKIWMLNVLCCWMCPILADVNSKARYSCTVKVDLPILHVMLFGLNLMQAVTLAASSLILMQAGTDNVILYLACIRCKYISTLHCYFMAYSVTVLRSLLRCSL